MIFNDLKPPKGGFGKFFLRGCLNTRAPCDRMPVLVGLGPINMPIC